MILAKRPRSDNNLKALNCYEENHKKEATYASGNAANTTHVTENDALRREKGPFFVGGTLGQQLDTPHSKAFYSPTADSNIYKSAKLPGEHGPGNGHPSATQLSLLRS